MDIETISKYFPIGCDLSIVCFNQTLIGKLVDISSAAIVLENEQGLPIIIAPNSIQSCTSIEAPEKPMSEFDDKENGSPEAEIIIKELVNWLNSVYDSESIDTQSNIRTNGTITSLSATGVEVLGDSGDNFTCVKPYCVGYNRENAIPEKRIYALGIKNGLSYQSLIQMTYGELYERFIKALQVKPYPRVPILKTILTYLSKEFTSKKINKHHIKELICQLDRKKTAQDPIVSAHKLQLEDLSSSQLSKINEAISTLDLNPSTHISEKIRLVDDLIKDRFTIELRRAAVKKLILGFPILPDKVLEENSEDGNVYVAANCEIFKYYPKYSNGSARDSKNNEIRFKRNIVVDDALKLALDNFDFSSPIPAVCVYNKLGKWPTALFVASPGTIEDYKLKISALREAGELSMADAIDNYLFDNYKVSIQDNRMDISVTSSVLLEKTRRQRLIKNFNEAELGFLELIHRGFEYDAVVRDLASMYNEWRGAEFTIEFLEAHISTVQDKIKTLNMLAPLYQSIGNVEKAIEANERILAFMPSNNKSEKIKRQRLEIKIAKLKTKINEIPRRIFSSDAIPAELVRWDANHLSTDVLAYMEDKSLEEKLRFLNERISELQNSKDLPSYYLAKVALLEEQGALLDQKDKIMSLMADYCRAKARNLFSVDAIDSAREYLLQGIMLNNRIDLYCLYVFSLGYEKDKVLEIYNTNFKDYSDITGGIFLREDDDTFLALIALLRLNTVESKKLIRYLYQGQPKDWLCDEYEIDGDSPQAFIETLQKCCAESSDRINNLAGLLKKSLLQVEPIALCNELLSAPSFTTAELAKIDIKALDVLKDASNYLLDYTNAFSYDDCENIYHKAVSVIKDTVSDIEKTPSVLSTVYVMPLLLKLNDILDRWNDKKYKDTLPNITITAPDDASLYDEWAEFQLTITNQAGSSKASNVILTITNIDGQETSIVDKLESPLVQNTPIITCHKHSIANKASFDSIHIEYQISYQDVRARIRTQKGQIDIPINEGEEYEDFENPYLPYVKSNAVQDESMFYGRDEIVKHICKYVLEDYRGFVLYGQKRSGKSSVLYHITKKLRASKEAFAVDYSMGNNIVQDSSNEKETLANLFYTIISEIGRAIKEVDRNIYKTKIGHIVPRKEFSDYPEQTFKSYIEIYRDIIKDDLHYKQDKIVLVIDEFTYLYYHILEKKIMPSIMEYWKGLVESRIFSFVFAGQDSMPRFMEAFQNVFASMSPTVLTYIDETSARKLIEEPIWNHTTNTSRFSQEAVNRIVELTACSPFYIMILCSELVKWARLKKRIPITGPDVNTVVEKMIYNESSISRKDFDNLISCGETKLDIINHEDSLRILKEIAIKSRNIGYADYKGIGIFNHEKIENIINDLIQRQVIERCSSSRVKIKVELFKLWLLNHE